MTRTVLVSQHCSYLMSWNWHMLKRVIGTATCFSHNLLSWTWSLNVPPGEHWKRTCSNNMYIYIYIYIFALCTFLQSEIEHLSAFAMYLILHIFQGQITHQKKKVEGVLNIMYEEWTFSYSFIKQGINKNTTDPWISWLGFWPTGLWKSLYNL